MFEASASSTQKAYVEWIVKVSEIFLQSRIRANPQGPPTPSRHFALVIPEKFDVRTGLEGIERLGFFENRRRMILEFTSSGAIVERLTFQFFPPRDIPPQNRASEDKRGSLALPRRLTIAARAAFSASRLLPAYGDRFKRDLSYTIRFEVPDPATPLEGSGFLSLEVCSLPSQLGALKFFISHERSSSPTPQESVSLPQFRVQENFVQAENIQMLIEESPPIAPVVRAALLDVSPISPLFSTGRSEISSQVSVGNYSPISTSRDLLTDVWPILPLPARRSPLALTAPGSASSAYGDDVMSSSSSSEEGGSGKFEVSGDDAGDSGLGALLLFSRNVRLVAFRNFPVEKLTARIAHFEDVDRHLQLLPLSDKH